MAVHRDGVGNLRRGPPRGPGVVGDRAGCPAERAGVGGPTVVPSASLGRKIARVALAGRVLTLCYYALRDEVRLPCLPARSVRSGWVEARSAHVMASVDGHPS
jgi:hypothetical protein